MNELRKLIVFFVVTLIFIYMIRINFKVLNKYGHKKILSAMMIAGLGLISTGTLCDVIAEFMDINLRVIISTCFTAGAIVFASFMVLWTKHLVDIISNLNNKAHNDQMTGVYNRVGFENVFKEKTTSDSIFYIMIFDLDKTKMINDTFGHAKGDEYIINSAKIIQEVIGEKGFVGRTGGDEFVAFLENIDKEEIDEIKEKIKNQVSNIFTMQGTHISIGYSIFGKDGRTLEELLKIADKRMYQDKNIYRERVVVNKYNFN